MRKLLSFVIPCYRSENTIEKVIAEIISVVSQKPEYDYEIIAVNDCSPDNVYSVLLKLADENEKIKIIDFSKNFGKHSAVLAGMELASGDFIVGLDDDGQCPVNRLWDLLEPVENGSFDYSMADYPVLKESGIKRIGSKINSLMSRILVGRPKGLYFSNFYLMKKFVAKEMVKYKNPYPYLEGLTIRTTLNIVTVPMEERERFEGTGHYTLRKSLALWFNGFTAFSIIPLRIASILGFVVAALGFFFGLFVVIRKVLNPSIAVGYSSTISVILFIGGIIMIMLGLIGEYLGRIYISLNSSPQYVIKETVNFKNKED